MEAMGPNDPGCKNKLVAKSTRCQRTESPTVNSDNTPADSGSEARVQTCDRRRFRALEVQRSMGKATAQTEAQLKRATATRRRTWR
jgi:hypothetical protein